MMKTRKITLKKSLVPIAAVIAFHSLSYFQPQSKPVTSMGQAPFSMKDDKGDKAFKTHIFFGQNESKVALGQSSVSRRLIDHYGG